MSDQSASGHARRASAFATRILELERERDELQGKYDTLNRECTAATFDGARFKLEAAIERTAKEAAEQRAQALEKDAIRLDFLERNGHTTLRSWREPHGDLDDNEYIVKWRLFNNDCMPISGDGRCSLRGAIDAALASTADSAGTQEKGK